MTKPLAPPNRWLFALEARAALDAARMVPTLLRQRITPPVRRPGAPIIVLPGFGSDDRYTAPLRSHLRRLGRHVEGWGLGFNRAGLDLPHTQDDLAPGWDIERRAVYNGEASVPYLCDRMTERTAERIASLGEPVTLIGWSLGGYVAREVARDLPDGVNQVITLGSPTIGGPKYTAAAPLFRQRGMDLDWIETEIAKRDATPIHQPITAIFSRTDAVVSWRAAQDHCSPNVRHVQVRAAHLGMGFNPTIWALIRAALARPPAGRSPV